MNLRLPSGCCLALALSFAAAATAQPSAPLSPDAASERVARALHRRIDSLGGEIRSSVSQAGGAAFSSPEGVAELALEIEGLRTRLRAYQRDSRRLPEPLRVLLERKLRSLTKVVGELERWLGVPSGARSEPSAPPVAGSTGPGPVAAKAAPANDACVQASPITLGESATGETTEATQDGIARCGSSFFSPDVWFRYDAAESGHVNADTFGSGFDVVLSVHTGCPGTQENQLSCRDDTIGLQPALGFHASQGTSYWIRVSGFDGVAGPFELHLGTGAQLSGALVDEVTGEPIEGAVVDLLQRDGRLAGSSAPTSPGGAYTISTNTAGGYRLRTDVEAYLDELFDDVPCPPRNCDVTAGEEVPVASNAAVEGIDFSLVEGAVITGTVRDTRSDPIADVWVEVVRSDYLGVGAAFSGPDGRYRVAGLGAGTYFAVASASGFATERYDGLTCDPGTFCDIVEGTPIELADGETAAGVDFSLERFGGFSGAVVHAATGFPIADAAVTIYDADGFFEEWLLTDESGGYTIGGLRPGTYLILAGDDFPGATDAFLTELYDGVPCPGGLRRGCEVSDGTQIGLDLDEERTGIVFALDRKAGVAGRVIDGTSGDPLAASRVGVFGEDGREASHGLSGTDGVFSAGPLDPGVYFLRAGGVSGYVTTVYEGFQCPAETCDVTAGTPVVVTTETATTGIDIVLERAGAISGTLADATGDRRLQGEIRVWGRDGVRVGRGFSGLDGTYFIDGLPTGTYFATAFGHGFLDQLYEDRLCRPGCDPTIGTPIPVFSQATTAGIDFALGRPGTINGALFDATTGGPVNGGVLFWSSSGGLVGATNTRSGSYSWSGLFPGEYFVSTENYGGFADELYLDLPCDGGCDVTAGTPIRIDVGSVVSGVNLALRQRARVVVEVVAAETSERIDGAHGALRPLADLESGYFSEADASGLIVFRGIRAGAYRLQTSRTGFLPETYDDLQCFSCGPSKGDPLLVGSHGTVVVHVALLPADGTGIAGRVTGPASVPLAGVEIRIFDLAATLVATALTGPSGEYYSELPPATYFVQTQNDLGFDDRVYDGEPCDAACDPSAGTPVTVPAGLIAGRIDFSLEPAAIFADGFESGGLSAWTVQ